MTFPTDQVWVLTDPSGRSYRMQEYNQEITGCDAELSVLDPAVFRYGGSAHYVLNRWVPLLGWRAERKEREAPAGSAVSPAAASSSSGPPDLFVLGNITLHSGRRSAWKIDCDALTDESLVALAHLASTLLPPFKLAIGVPRGGLRFARHLQKYARDCDGLECLIVDDVLTTGESMEEMRLKHPLVRGGPALGIVIFARGSTPPWVRALFTCNSEVGA